MVDYNLQEHRESNKCRPTVEKVDKIVKWELIRFVIK
jgi:hypothetical protein